MQKLIIATIILAIACIVFVIIIACIRLKKPALPTFKAFNPNDRPIICYKLSTPYKDDFLADSYSGVFPINGYTTLPKDKNDLLDKIIYLDALQMQPFNGQGYWYKIYNGISVKINSVGTIIDQL